MKLIRGLVTAAVLALPTSAFAVTFDLDEGTNYEWSREYTEGDLNLTVTGYTEYNGNIYQNIVGSFSGNGLGVEWKWSPEHAIDNHEGYDMLLLTFDQAVSLDAVNIGWSQNDSDMAVLGYTGAGNASSNFAGSSWYDALSSDWGGMQFTNVKENGLANANPLGLTSTSWLVGAYVPTIDAQDNGGYIGRFDSPNQTYGDDYVKVKSVSVTTPHTVPEIDASQSGIALGLLISLMAVFRERRKKILGR